MFSVGLDVDTLVSRVMVTLFLSLGLYAGNLDYIFGPLSLTLNKVTVKNILVALGIQSIKSLGGRLFGKIQNLYYKFYFALFPLAQGPSQPRGGCLSPSGISISISISKQKKNKGSFKRFSVGARAKITQGLFANNTGEKDKLKSKKAVIQSLVLSVFNHIITKLKFKNEQSAGNSLFRLPLLRQMSREMAPLRPLRPLRTGRELLPLLPPQLQSNFISPRQEAQVEAKSEAKAETQSEAKSEAKFEAEVEAQSEGLVEALAKNYVEKYHISDHLIKHKKPSFGSFDSNNVDFGYYLSGLIEGNGLFENHKLEIKFSSYGPYGPYGAYGAYGEKDISLAYYIKKEIGYGKVIKETQNRPSNGGETYGVKYVLVHSEGLKKVLNLLNGKLININTINQLLTHKYNTIFNINILPPANFDITSNYWLTGFIDAKGYFFINSLAPLSFKGKAAPFPNRSLEFSTLPFAPPVATSNSSEGKGRGHLLPRLQRGTRWRGDNKDNLDLEFYIKFSLTKAHSPLTPNLQGFGKGETKNLSQNLILNQNQNQIQNQFLNLNQNLNLNQTQSQKAESFFILNVIKKTFGGNIYLEGKESKQTIVYKTSDVKSIKLIIDYLDKFQLNSYKHVKFFQ